MKRSILGGLRWRNTIGIPFVFLVLGGLVACDSSVPQSEIEEPLATEQDEFVLDENQAIENARAIDAEQMGEVCHSLTLQPPGIQIFSPEANEIRPSSSQITTHDVPGPYGPMYVRKTLWNVPIHFKVISRSNDFNVLSTTFETYVRRKRANGTWPGWGELSHLSEEVEGNINHERDSYADLFPIPQSWLHPAPPPPPPSVDTDAQIRIRARRECYEFSTGQRISSGWGTRTRTFRIVTD